MSTSPVIVIGAGPAGLAVAASLGRRGVRAVVLERADDVGASWRRHYERLHLHTTRRWSGLPGFPIPRALRPMGRPRGRRRLPRDVRRAPPARRAHRRRRSSASRGRGTAAGWSRPSAGESFTGSTVVVATGYNHTPVPPQWPGVETLPGELVHASAYRNAEPYRGKDVLVVGAGNTGSRSRSTSPRAARRACGSPSGRRRTSSDARTSAGLRRAPGSSCGTCRSRSVDRIAAVVARVEVPDLSSYGLPRPTTGLYSRVSEGSVPLQDVGLIAAVQARRSSRSPRSSRSTTARVVLADGSRVTPDVVVAATGYRRGLEPLVGDLDVLDDRGLPRVHGPRTSTLGARPLLHRVHQPDQRHVPRAADRRRADRGRRSAAPDPALAPAPSRRPSTTAPRRRAAAGRRAGPRAPGRSPARTRPCG